MSKQFNDEEGVLVKNWHFIDPGNSGIPSHAYIVNHGGAVALEGIPSQGNPVGRGGDFNQHMITVSGNHLYDTSYGTPSTPPLNGDPDIKQYEDAAFQGFHIWIDILEKYVSRINITTPEHPSDAEFDLLPPY